MKARGLVRIVLAAVLLSVLGTHVSASAVPGQVRFTAAGDFGATANTSAVLTTIDTLGSDLTVTLGDLSYGTTGQEQAWCDFVTSRVGAGYPFELLAGNHESNGVNGNINDFSACLPNQLPGVVGTYGRQYYVDVPAADPLVRFIQISPSLTFPDGTYSYAAGSARYQWTEQAIDGARANAIPWVVVSMHKPCISLGRYSCDVGSALFDLLLAKKVDLILSGHEHNYQRSNQLSLGAGCSTLALNSSDTDCVSDADSTFVQGKGSVVAIVGTGGNTLYEVNSTDPEAGYFAAMSGSNIDPTWGVLDVAASESGLQASFARASGGSFTDSFSISRDTTPNQLPTAAFTAQCTDLTCAFDGSGSTDPDGSIVSHAWDFGDGSTGTGATVNHAYASAGTYSVRLTVTDDRGATAAATQSVNVTSPGVVTYVSDQFSRTATSGFGSAPVGGSYTYSGSSTLFAVNGAAGTIRTAAGSGPAAYLAGVAAPSADLRASFGLDKQPTGSGLYLSALVRRTAAGAYIGKVRVTSTGTVAVELTRRPSGGSEVVLQSSTVISGLTYAVGDTLNLRVQAVGDSPTTLRAKVWKVGTPEPAAWQRSVTDATSGMQTAGSVGLSPYYSGSATNSPMTVLIDEWAVTSP